MRRATKVRLYPTVEQERFLRGQFGAVRFVYNKSLEVMSHQYNRHGRKLSAKHDLKKVLPVAKRNPRYAWMKEYDSMALQQACINLDRAFQNFFAGRGRYPRFKSKRRGTQSSYHCTNVEVGDNWVKIPKVGTIKARVHREIFGSLKSITLTLSPTGKYHAVVLVEDGLSEPVKPHIIIEDAVLGVDLGISHLLSDSSGHQEPNPRHLSRSLKNLRRKQQKLSNTEKGSRRRAKARLLVAKAHERVANARADNLHKLSRRMVDENQAVIFEDLNINGMIKNKRLARHIADAGWANLVEMATYKADRSGKHVVKVSRWLPSSKTCSSCNHKVKAMPLEVREWTCPGCGEIHDRDINAALNIKKAGIQHLLAEGLSVTARGDLRKSDSSVAVGETRSLAA